MTQQIILHFKNQVLAWGMAKTGSLSKNKDEKLDKLREKVTTEFVLPKNDDCAFVLKLPLTIGRYYERTPEEELPTLPVHRSYMRVSKQHAIIYEDSGKLKIKNLSKNGTFILRDGKKESITETEIQNNDAFYLGERYGQTFVFTIQIKQPILRRIKQFFGF